VSSPAKLITMLALAAACRPAPPRPIASEPGATSATRTSRDGAIDVEAECQAFLAEHEARYEAAQQAADRQRDDCIAMAEAEGRSGEGCDADESSPPACGIAPLAAELASPWDRVSLLVREHSTAHGPKSCQLVISLASGASFAVGDDHECGPWDGGPLALRSATVEELVDGPPGELVIRHATGGDDGRELAIACRLESAAVRCTPELELSGDGWAVDARFGAGAVTFTTRTGEPPPSHRGRHALAFD
jgi:hypothetical protein